MVSNPEKGGFEDHAGQLVCDLAALRSNWRKLGAQAAGAEVSAVVKANAYGLGIEQVVPALDGAGCRTFFVAHVEEGIRARSVAPQSVIYVLNGLAIGRLADYLKHRLRPVLGSLEELAFWERYGQGGERRGEPAAFHIDTGMNRLGLGFADGLRFLEQNTVLPACIDLIMTHFVAAEEEGAAITTEQITRMAQLVAAARRGGNARIKFSLCNSSGHFIENVPFYDLTRPGFALYGGNPTPARVNPMKPVIHLSGAIVALREVEVGESVGYNSRWVVPQKSRIATLSLGYADGLPRAMGFGGGSALVAGVECPFVGVVSMDLITVDITHVTHKVQVGDEAVLIGGSLDIDRVGRSGGTSGYEILTSLGKRFRRVYRV